MTFLLFLASVAVLEYLVRGTGKVSGPEAKYPDIAVNQVAAGAAASAHHGASDDGPLSHETAVGDLVALAKALNSQRSIQPSEGERTTEQAQVESDSKIHS